MSSPITGRSIDPASRTMVVEVEPLRLQDLAAAEGEELAGQLGRPLAGALDLLDLAPFGIVRVEAGEEQLAVAGDDGDQVVEVVGDAAGELAHRLHAGGEAKPLRGLPTFGVVEEVAMNLLEAALLGRDFRVTLADQL